VNLNYFQQHLMMKMDVIIHDDHKYLKYHTNPNYYILHKNL
jgi:hypothetical protein